MKLTELLENVQVLELAADPMLEISGVTCDSRKIEKGNLFVAISGYAADGNRYIPMALEKGAVAIVTTKKPEAAVPYVLVQDDRQALACIGANFYGHPADSMRIVGITGTNGKSSITWLLEQVVEKTTGQKAGLIGTVENHLGNQVVGSTRTTPQSIELQEMFAQMRDAGCKYVMMEVSSHSIDQERIGGIRFAVAAFTNLTHDHLDYHKTMESYCDVKSRLFTRCDKAVINMDDPWYEKIIGSSQADIMTVSAKQEAGLYARDIDLRADGISFTAVYGDQNVPVCVPIPGRFTVYNVLTVLGVCLQLGISLEKAAAALRDVEGIKGRIEVVPTPGKDYTVLIDYAHTPDGMENILNSVRDFCKGRLISLFFCAGDRDHGKRPMIGEISTRLADFSIITTGDLRTESADAILKDILAGVGDAANYVVIEDHDAAIRYAMDMAKKDDIIVLCAKGHELYMDIQGVKRPYDERKVVAAHLQEERVCL